MRDENLHRWVTVVRWARSIELKELTKKRKDTTTFDLRTRWLTAMKARRIKSTAG